MRRGVRIGIWQKAAPFLGKAARLQGAKGWFDSVGLMEEATRDIIGPRLPAGHPVIGQFIDLIFKWIADGAR